MNHAIDFESFDDLLERKYFHKTKLLFPEKSCLCMEMNRSQNLDNFLLMN